MSLLTTAELRRLLPDTPVWLKPARRWGLQIRHLQACQDLLAFWKVRERYMPVSWWVKKAQRRTQGSPEIQRLCEAVHREGRAGINRPNLFVLVRAQQDGWRIVDGNHRLIGALLYRPRLVRYVGVWYGVDV
jgi:hypothetical protein